MQGRKTTTRAFRIDDTVDRQLRQWAEREGVSVSFLANKALRRLVEWDMYADRFGFIAMPREALSRMIELLSSSSERSPIIRERASLGIAMPPNRSAYMSHSTSRRRALFARKLTLTPSRSAHSRSWRSTVSSIRNARVVVFRPCIRNPTRKPGGGLRDSRMFASNYHFRPAESCRAQCDALQT